MLPNTAMLHLRKIYGENTFPPPGLKMMMKVVDEILASDGFERRGRSQFKLQADLFPIAGWREHCDNLMLYVQKKGIIFAYLRKTKLIDADSFWIFDGLDALPFPEKWCIAMPIKSALPPRKKTKSEYLATKKTFQRRDDGGFSAVDMAVENKPSHKLSAQVESAEQKEIDELKGKLLMKDKNHQLEMDLLKKRIARLETDNAELKRNGMGDDAWNEWNAAVGVGVVRETLVEHWLDNVSAKELDALINEGGWEVVSLTPFPETQHLIEGGLPFTVMNVFGILRREKKL